VACEAYGCLADVVDSDHKPVWARLTLTVAAVDAAAARAAGAAALDAADGEKGEGSEAPPPPPRLVLDAASLDLRRDARPAATLTLTNASPAPASWRAAALDGGALPRWLDLRPAGGRLGGGERVGVRFEVVAGDTFYSARPLDAAVGVFGVGDGGGESEARVDVRLLP
jgi:hypothetical protein